MCGLSVFVQRTPIDTSLLCNPPDTLLSLYRNCILFNSDQHLYRKISNRHIYCLFDGNIYNSEHLKTKYKFTTDINEIFLDLYIRIGLKSTLTEICGIFSGIIIDTNETNDTYHIFAFRDHLGIKPLYYNINDTMLSFASDIKSLSKGDIRQFPPGHYFVSKINYNIKSKHIHSGFTPYWNIQDIPFKLLTLSEQFNINSIIFNKLNNAVKIRMSSDSCCILTGGFDSAVIAALLAKNSPTQIHTYAIGLSGSDDLRNAQLISKHINSIHTEIIMNYNDLFTVIDKIIKLCETSDIKTIRASIWKYFLCKYIYQNTRHRRLFMGIGADELFGGYLYFKNAPNAYISHYESLRLLKEIPYSEAIHANHILSHYNLEPCLPFLDINFLEFYVSLFPNIKFEHDILEKSLVRNIFADILPYEIVSKNKSPDFFNSISTFIKDRYDMTEQEYYDNKLHKFFSDKCKNNIREETTSFIEN